MALTEKQESIATKIRGLMAKTTDRGATEDEAMLAAELVGKLMQQYDLSMSDVELNERPCEQRLVRIYEDRTSPLHSLIIPVAEYCDVKAWLSNKNNEWNTHTKKYGVPYVVFFGPAEDLAMAEYLLVHLRAVVGSTYHEYKKQPFFKSLSSSEKKQTDRSFRVGMVRRISARLREMKDARKAEAAVECRDLVVVKMAVVTREYDKLSLNLKPGHSLKMGNNYRAYLDGQAAGNKVDILTPISGK